MATISKRAADELDAEPDGMKSEGEGGSEDMNELNEEEYEKERMENIKNNAALLDSLGLSSVPSVRPHETKPRIGKTEARLKSERSGSGAGVKRRKVVVEPTRRSGRVRAMAEDEEEGKKRKYVEDDDSPTTYTTTTKAPLLPKSKAPIIPGPSYSDEEGEETTAPLPTRNADGVIQFEGRWGGVFTPNVSPEEMFEGGAFGGGFFVSTHSRILSAPLPSSSSLETLPFTPTPTLLPTHYTSENPDGEVNRFKVRAGQSLQEWEKAGWIWAGDPRGWAEWYCRFWGGRRCGDDERQVRRWLKVAGPTGRFKRSLLKKVQLNGGVPALEDEEIGAVLRQCLWQWGYQLTRSEYDAAMRGE